MNNRSNIYWKEQVFDRWTCID